MPWININVISRLRGQRLAANCSILAIPARMSPFPLRFLAECQSGTVSADPSHPRNRHEAEFQSPARASERAGPHPALPRIVDSACVISNTRWISPPGPMGQAGSFPGADHAPVIRRGRRADPSPVLSSSTADRPRDRDRRFRLQSDAAMPLPAPESCPRGSPRRGRSLSGPGS